MHDRLGIRISRESMTLLQKFVPKFGVVIDFAIQHDPDAAVLIRYRLMPTSHVDDTEPPKSQLNAVTEINPLIIRATMKHRGTHLAQVRLGDDRDPVKFEDSANSTH